jgi:hypothetical protein
LSAEHKINTLDTVFDFKLVPFKEALFKIIEANKEVMVTMFQENIRGRLLIYYLNQFPIAFTSSNKRIHWNEKIMLGILNPMPKTYHRKTQNVDLQAQQDILMKNTLPYTARSVEASKILYWPYSIYE